MKILVVDDERDIQTLFEQKFRKEIRNKMVEFVFALSGKEALAHLDKRDHEFELILSDINMPGMNGLVLLQQIKQKYVKPPPDVLMITAYANDENHEMATSLGAVDLLTKPIDFGLLKEKLNKFS